LVEGSKIIYSINQIKLAGKNLIIERQDEKSLEILSYWRAYHVNSLDDAYSIVEKYGKQIDSNILLAKRLKRTESIVNKIERLKGKLQLTTMNDIAGCRAILPTQREVNKLVGKLAKKKKFKIFNNYINTPKESGYRSIHMIGNFEEISKSKILQVELQVRTYVQHSWATAVEIVDLFTKDSIKTNEGTKEWSDFFVYASKVLVLFDDNSFVNKQARTEEEEDKNTDKVYNYFVTQIKKDQTIIQDIQKCAMYSKNLEVASKFELFASSIKLTKENQKRVENKDIHKDGYILLIMDKVEESLFDVHSRFFKKDMFEIATKEYLQAEKDVFLQKHFVTALVSSSAMNEIEEAYPNYFADSTKFIQYIAMIDAA
jgi:ppGpp synthetase/RelA/SpoT-type nucleotidyltranferase